MDKKSDLLDEPVDFSPALGGPPYQFFLRTRLSAPMLELLIRRIIVITAVAWLALCLNTLRPDRAGGLGFLARSMSAFSPVLLARTVLRSGSLLIASGTPGRNCRNSN
jgi:hypothetical protein